MKIHLEGVLAGRTQTPPKERLVSSGIPKLLKSSDQLRLVMIGLIASNLLRAWQVFLNQNMAFSASPAC